MEGCFKILNIRRVYQLRYENRGTARLDIVHWIEAYYNSKRMDSAIAYSSPVDFERSSQAA